MRSAPTSGVPRFFVAEPLSAHASLVLEERAAHHAIRVLRLRESDAVVLFDGSGGEYSCRIEAISGRTVTVRTGEHDPVERESPLALTLVQGLSSSERMDYTVQKAVELGVTTIIAVVAEKSVSRLAGDRAEARAAHWRRIAIAACEQCGRNRVPEISVPQSFARWLSAAPRTGLRLLALPGAHASLASVLSGGAREITVAAGPEAGFSEREDRDLLGSGFQAVHLGPRVLRTETVAPAILAAMNALAGDWS
jgi:16S rRNA (uracil1498-N3)-methyltransferase